MINQDEKLEEYILISNIVSTHYDNLSKIYNNPSDLILALQKIDEILSYFEIKIYDGYMYLMSKIYTADYMFITKMVTVSNSLSIYSLAVVLEEIEFTKGLKIIPKIEDN